MKILVVGGCRFIGYDIAISLAEDGYSVKIIDDVDCPGDPRDMNVNLIDIESSNIQDYVKNVDILINAYEFDGVNHARVNTGKAFAGNIEVAYKIFYSTINSNINKIVHLSSAAVYGEAEYLPIPETHRTRPLSWYGASKLAGETIINTLYTERRIPTVILRVFNAYGPGEWLRNNPGVIHEFMIAVLTGRYLRLEGDGSQVRDFIHVADVVRAAIEALNLPPGIYNVGTGKGISIADLARKIIKIHGSPVDVVLSNPRPADIKRSVADISKITGASNWSPAIPLDNGLKHLYKIYRERLVTRQ